MLGGNFQSFTPKFECLPPLLFSNSIYFNRGGIAVTPHENNGTKPLTLSHLYRRRVRLLSPTKLEIITPLIIKRTVSPTLTSYCQVSVLRTLSRLNSLGV